MNMKLRALLFLSAFVSASAAEAATTAPLPAPSGITFQPIGRPQGYGAQRGNTTPRPWEEVVYGNEKGLTLYTSDNDKDGKSNCAGECATTWLPAVPVANAKEVPDWTIIKREDGRRQWAHYGKPLYTHKDDKEGGEVMGLGADPELDRRGGNTGNALKAKLPDGWKIHKLTTAASSTLPIAAPTGFAIKEVIDAKGIVIVDIRDPVHQKVVYFYSGDVAKDRRACEGKAAVCPRFVPVVAPELGISTAPDWTIVNRTDGYRQWVYQGKPLYTFEGDKITDDVHGENAEKRWQLALVRQFFMPANVSFRDDDRHGHILTTSKGMALYRRDLNSFLPSTTRFPHNRAYRPRVGRMVRDVPCETCDKAFLPLLAPVDAQPNGYWGVHVMADGRKQWTYKDYTLFSFKGDEVPDDVSGDLIYEFNLGDDPDVDNDAGFPALYKAGFNWGVAGF